MGPETEAFLVHGDKTAMAINDWTALPQWLALLGLKLACSGLQLIGLHQLQPGHPTHQPQQPSAQDEKHPPESLRGNLLKGNDTGTGAVRRRPSWGGQPGAHQ